MYCFIHQTGLSVRLVLLHRCTAAIMTLITPDCTQPAFCCITPAPDLLPVYSPAKLLNFTGMRSIFQFRSF